jgi:hypothetical protein
MKKAITVMSFILIGIYAKAECCVLQCQQPPEPKVITKTKVVEKVVEKPVFVPVYKVEVVEKKVRKNNRISLLFGVAPSKLEETSSEVTMELGSVFGLQYQRMVQDDLSVGLQLQNNKTVLGTVGIDF